MIYGDDLYHFGIKGMHWGIRRFQNADGSLTSEGRERYGSKVKNAASTVGRGLKKGAKATGHGIAVGAKAVGKGVKKAGNALAKNYEIKHPKNPKKMTDEELEKRIKRLEMEKRVKDLEKQMKPEIGKGRRIVEDILSNGAKTFANAYFQNAARKAFEEKDDDSISGKYRKNVLEKYDDSMTESDLLSAVKRYNSLRILEGKKSK